jgi:hypothetical protein
MAVAKRSLADLAAAFTSKASEGGSGNATWKLFFPFWKMPVDTVSTVRFLPDADEENPLGFITENLTHELNINGKREKVACLKMHGEQCPICDLSAKFYDKNSSDFSEEMGKMFYRKKSYIGQVLVLETPVEHDAAQIVKLIEFGPQIFKQIQAAFQSGDLEAAPYDLKGGYNFRFRKSVTGSGQNSYTTSNFAPKQTDVADALLEEITLYSLGEYRTQKIERTAIDAMLIAAQTGASYSPAGASETPMQAALATPTPKASPAPAAAAQAAPAEVADVPAEGVKLSVVEQLRQRAAASKAAAQANA